MYRFNRVVLCWMMLYDHMISYAEVMVNSDLSHVEWGGLLYYVYLSDFKRGMVDLLWSAAVDHLLGCTF